MADDWIKRETQHCPLLRLRIHDETQECLDDHVEPCRNILWRGLRKERPHLDLGMSRDQQCPLIWKVTVCRGSRNGGSCRRLFDQALRHKLTGGSNQRAASSFTWSARGKAIDGVDQLFDTIAVCSEAEDRDPDREAAVDDCTRQHKTSGGVDPP